jgi:hypothetical protein
VSGTSRVIGRFATGASVLVLVAAIAGCASVMRVAYNNGDFALRMVANEYLDLQGKQTEVFKARFARLHEWHRVEELPRYADALDSAAARILRGATRADVTWAVATIRERYRSLAAQAVDESIPVLMTLAPDNLAALRKKFEASNLKFTEQYMTGDAAARKSARIDAIEGRFAEWLGSVSDAQRNLIADYVRTQPANRAMRLADRKARQQELVDMLERERDPAVLREKLRAFFVNYDSHRSAEFARASRAWEERLITLITGVLDTASPAQREYAAVRLTRYAEDFRVLADEGRAKLGSGTRAAEEAAHPGT